MTISERVHEFGAIDGHDGLIGIVTLPSEDALATSVARPFVVLLNAGLVHRVGPFGMGVELARSLAQRGFRVLRFDQSGLGDSAPRPSSVPIEQQVVADGRAAMELLSSRYGATHFVIGGLCSGALNAHRICLADDRVVAMWMLDGYAYPGKLYRRQVLMRRLRNPGSWKQLARASYTFVRDRAKAIAGHGQGPKTDQAAAASDDRKSIFYQDWPAIPDARREIEQMVDRGVRLLFVYTGGWSSFVDPLQFDEMFPALRHREQISVLYYPHADHSYLALEDRAAMLRHVGDFVNDLPQPA